MVNWYEHNDRLFMNSMYLQQGNITEFTPGHILITIPYELSDGGKTKINCNIPSKGGWSWSVRGYFDCKPSGSCALDIKQICNWM
jgi:hypothetical protein